MKLNKKFSHINLEVMFRLLLLIYGEKGMKNMSRNVCTKM